MDDWPVDDFVRYCEVFIMTPIRFFAMIDLASRVFRFVLCSCTHNFRSCTNTRNSTRKVESTLYMLKRGHNRLHTKVEVVMTNCTTHMRVLADHECIALLG
jgi:hypothetical protein